MAKDSGSRAKGQSSERTRKKMPGATSRRQLDARRKGSGRDPVLEHEGAVADSSFRVLPKGGTDNGR